MSRKKASAIVYSGRQVRTLREEANLTRRDIAKALGDTYTVEAVRRWENNKYGMPDEILTRFLSHLEQILLERQQLRQRGDSILQSFKELKHAS